MTDELLLIALADLRSHEYLSDNCMHPWMMDERCMCRSCIEQRADAAIATTRPNEESIDRAAVAAWWRVAQTLDKLAPGWSDNELSGADAAEQAIAAIAAATGDK